MIEARAQAHNKRSFIYFCEAPLHFQFAAWGLLFDSIWTIVFNFTHFFFSLKKENISLTTHTHIIRMYYWMCEEIVSDLIGKMHFAVRVIESHFGINGQCTHRNSLRVCREFQIKLFILCA